MLVEVHIILCCIIFPPVDYTLIKIIFSVLIYFFIYAKQKIKRISKSRMRLEIKIQHK